MSDTGDEFLIGIDLDSEHVEDHFYDGNDSGDEPAESIPIVSLERDSRPASVRRVINAHIQPECCVSVLGGATEQIFTGHVLTFLTARELCLLSQCSLFFSRITYSPALWKALLQRDFLSTVDESSLPSVGSDRTRPATMRAGRMVTRSIHSPRGNSPRGRAGTTGTGVGSVTESTVGLLSLPENYSLAARTTYIEKVSHFNLQVTRKEQSRLRYLENVENDVMLSRAEVVLDVTQIRLLVPLPMITLFLSILLLAMRYDGYDLSIWICAAPVLFFVFYLLVCIVLASFLCKSSNAYRTLWTNLGSPIQIYYTEFLNESKLLTYVSLFVLLMCTLEVILVAVKLAVETTSSSVLSSLPWGVVFLPIWVLFALFCVSPMLGCLPSWFIFTLVVVWIPLFIIAVCLVVKFTGEEHHTTAAEIPMSLIFTPLWLMEFVTLVGSLCFLLLGIHRYRRGFMERLDEHIGEICTVFVASWLLLAPFIIFQSMISARDAQQIDHHHHPNHHISVTSVDTVISLLIFVAVIMLGLFLTAVFYTTSAQEQRHDRRLVLMGAADIFPV